MTIGTSHKSNLNRRRPCGPIDALTSERPSSQSLRDPHHIPNPPCQVCVATAASTARSYRRRVPHKAGRHDGSICGAMAVARKMTPLPSACASTGSTQVLLRCDAARYGTPPLRTHTRSHATLLRRLMCTTSTNAVDAGGLYCAASRIDRSRQCERLV